MRKIKKSFFCGALLAAFLFFIHPAARAEEKPVPFFTLQAGVSKDLSSTEKEAKKIAGYGYKVFVVKKDDVGYRIWIEKFKDKDSALSAKKELSARGVETILKNESGPFQYEKSYEAPKVETPPPVKNTSPTNTATNTAAVTVKPSSASAILQSGIYKTKSAADKQKEKIQNAGYFAYVVAVKKGKRVFYSVRVGESGNLSKEELAKKLQALNFKVEWVQ